MPDVADDLRREQDAAIAPWAEVAGAGLALAGGGGLGLVAYLYARIRDGRGERDAQLRAEMGKAIDSLRSDIDSAFVETDEFEALTEEILEKGARRRELNKREYYAAAFANSALPSRPSEAERYRLIDTLERLREAHLWLLAALLRDYTWPDDSGSSSGFEQEFKKAVPEANMEAVKLDWRDLEAVGLLAGFPSGMMSSGGARNFRARVTELGKRFHQFVVLPYADVHPR
jgi:hypothetical protein